MVRQASSKLKDKNFSYFDIYRLAVYLLLLTRVLMLLVMKSTLDVGIDNRAQVNQNLMLVLITEPRLILESGSLREEL